MPVRAINLRTLSRPLRIVPTGDAPVTYLPALDVWRLDRRLVITDEVKGIRTTIRRGFLTDLASIKFRILTLLIAVYELGISPPVGHDGLYRTGGRGDGVWVRLEWIDPGGHEGEEPRYSRLEADQLFNRMMKRVQVVPWKRRMAYRTVRLLGRWAWKGER